MGKVKRYLLRRTLDRRRPDLYPDKRSIECAETMHLHERNLRIEHTLGEFQDLVAAYQDARRKLGSERPEPGKPTNWLGVSDISAEPGVTPDRFEVEESDYPTLNETTIHVHYRSLRLEFSHREWEEFAAGIEQASQAWSG